MKSNKTLALLSATLLFSMPLNLFSNQEIAASEKPTKMEYGLPNFTTIAKKSMPATVFIKSTIQQQSIFGSEGQNPFEFFNDDFFRRFFGMPNGQGFQQVPQPQQVVGGSGFFVSADGYLITNYHVVKDATKITVVLNDGREFSATVSGSDPRTDLAVLKINETNLPYLSFGSSDELEIGEWVIAIGSPFALESSLTVGVVSAKGRQDLGITSLEDFIQTDAVVNPGNSGGPLLNLQGQVIGVNTAILSRTGGYMGIGLSIPSHIVQNVMDQIINRGAVHHVYLGAVIQSIDQELASALGLEKQEGVLISDVMKDSPASKGGLQQGDVIMEYNGKAAKNISKFRNEIAMMQPGETVQLKILRNNKSINLKIPLEVQKEEGVNLAEMTQKLGIEVENATPEMATKFNIPSDASGVIVTKVQPGSAAQLAGIKPGFIITGVAMQGNEPKSVKNTAEFDLALKEVSKRKHVILIVRHQNYQRYYTIKIG